mmetsp:Transcript_7933/g.14547  ORF Transcript_7933/g.14547 Transcript_7933/m.14547 type:complete len:1293 (+) Transcript_7933:146-4024(+)
MASNFSDRLFALNHAAEGLQARIFHVNECMLSPGARPNVLDIAEYDKIRRQLERKFPGGFSKRCKGSDMFRKQAVIIREQLSASYRTLMDVLKFKQTAYSLLKQSAMVMRNVLQSANVSEIIWEVLALFSNYIRLQIQVCSFEEKKLIASLYWCASQLELGADCEKEQYQFTELSTYLVALGDNAIRMIQEEFMTDTNFTGLIQSALLCISPSYLQSINSSRLLEQQPFYIPVTSIAELEPSKKYVPYLTSPAAHDWICLSLLGCPTALFSENKNNGMLFHVLRAALSRCFVIPIFRDISILIHGQFQHLFSWLKPPEGLTFSVDPKMFIDEVTTTSTNGMTTVRRQVRRYLIWEFTRLLDVCTTTPGVLGPKSALILSILSVSQGEIMSYFHHYRTDSKCSNLGRVRQVDDGLFPKLIELHLQTIDVIMQNENVITRYNSECLFKCDAVKLNDIFESLNEINPSDSSNPPKKSMFDLRKKVKTLLDLIETQECTIKIRDLCRRIQVLLNTALDSGDSLPYDVNSILEHISTMSFHAQLAGSLYEALRRFASLGTLQFHGKSLRSVFKKCLESTEAQHIGSCLSLINLLRDSVLDFHPFNPEEVPTRSANAEQLASDLMHRITGKVQELLDSNHLFQRDMANIQNQSTKNSQSKQCIEKFTKKRECLLALGKSMCTGSILVCERELTPRVELIGTIEHWFHERVLDSIHHQRLSKAIQRPSKIVQNINLAMETVSLLCTHANIDHMHIIKTILAEQAAGTSGSLVDALDCVPVEGLRRAADAHEMAYAVSPNIHFGNIRDSTGQPETEIPEVPCISETIAGWLIHFIENTLGTSEDGLGLVSSVNESPSQRPGHAGIDADTATCVLRDAIQMPVSHCTCTSSIEWKLQNVNGGIGVPGIVYSPLIGGFLRVAELEKRLCTSKKKAAADSAILPAEQWLCDEDILEIVSLLGPRGVRVLERHFLAVVSTQAKRIHDILQEYRHRIEDFKQALRRSNKESIIEIARKMPRLANLTAALITTGHALTLRSLFQKALGAHLKKTAPDIAKTMQYLSTEYSSQSQAEREMRELVRPPYLVAAAAGGYETHSCTLSRLQRPPFAEYEANNDEYGIDMLGACFGMHKTPQSDLALRAVLASLVTTNDTAAQWRQLPFAVSASMALDAWKTSVLVSSVGAYANNIHLVPIAIHQLLGSILPLTCRINDESEDPQYWTKNLRVSMLNHVNSASSVLLEMRKPEFEHWPLVDMTVYLEHIVQASGYLLSTQDLNNIVPPALLHQRARYISKRSAPSLMAPAS